MIVKLHVGVGPLQLEDVDAAFTDTDCVVRFAGVSICPEHNSMFESFDISYPTSWTLLCLQVVSSGVVSSMLR